MDDTDWAYLAGFIDADGSFFINWEYQKKYKRLGIQPTLSSGVAKKQEKIIDYLHGLFGGYKWKYSKHLSDGLVLWHVKKHDQLVRIINGMLPYLMIKKKQAQLILKAIEIMKEAHESYPRRRTRDQMLRIADVSDEISDLNVKRKKSGKRKWTRSYIEKLLDETGIGGSERIIKGMKNFTQSGKDTRFKTSG